MAARKTPAAPAADGPAAPAGEEAAALLAAIFAQPPQVRLVEAPPSAFLPSRHNPRTDAEQGRSGLTASLAAGMLQLPRVQETPDGLELVDGERRWRSAQERGDALITAVVQEPVDAGRALLQRLIANLHRVDLNPIDYAEALKAGWFVVNAHAVGVFDAAAQAIASASTLRAALPALRAVLEAAGWKAQRPAVPQEQYARALGVGLSAAALRKALEVLSVDDQVAEAIRELPVTAAAVRALQRLPPEQQVELVEAIKEEPELAQSVRSIVQGITQRHRSVQQAVDVVQGRVALPTIAGAHGPADAPAMDDQVATVVNAVADQLIGMADQIVTIGQQVRAVSPGGLATIPDPHGSMLRDAIAMMQFSLQDLDPTGEADG